MWRPLLPEDQGLTDSLGVPVSVSAAADPDLASRYSRAEVTEVTRIYEEDNTNTATATARPHSCCTLPAALTPCQPYV